MISAMMRPNFGNCRKVDNQAEQKRLGARTFGFDALFGFVSLKALVRTA